MPFKSQFEHQGFVFDSYLLKQTTYIWQQYGKIINFNQSIQYFIFKLSYLVPEDQAIQIWCIIGKLV
jgi:hypothetical protein